MLGGIGEIIQKPQSLMMGAFNELAGTADEDRKFIDAYEYGEVDDTTENAKRYELAKMRVGDSSGQNASGLFSGGGLFQGFKEGLDNQLRPSDYIPDENIGGKIAGTAADIFIDPTVLAGGLLKGTTVADDLAKSSPKLAHLLEAAQSTGKLEKADLAGRAAQFGRRTLQGTLATGDPLTGLGAGQLIGVGERGLTSAISRALARGVGEKSDELIKGVADVAEEAVPTQGRLFEDVAFPEDGRLFDPNDLSKMPTGGVPTSPPTPSRPKTAEELMAALPDFQSKVPYAPTLPRNPADINSIPLPGTGVPGLRKELPVGSRPMPAPEGATPLDEALQGLLGRRQGEAFTGGQRGDTIVRALLESSRSGKSGRFLNPEQKALLQQWVNSPDALTTALRGFYG